MCSLFHLLLDSVCWDTLKALGSQHWVLFCRNLLSVYSPLRAYLFALVGGVVGMGVCSVSFRAAALCAFARVVLQAPV